MNYALYLGLGTVFLFLLRGLAFQSSYLLILVKLPKSWGKLGGGWKTEICPSIWWGHIKSLSGETEEKESVLLGGWKTLYLNFAITPGLYV